MKDQIEGILKKSGDRVEFCQHLILDKHCVTIVEIGVFKGVFAESILKKCQNVQTYFMIDPWRNLEDWNKPANVDNTTFEAFYNETLSRTEFAHSKRKVLKGKTTEVIDQIRDESLDFAYIDGDHTLKGISIDLINVWGKLKKYGFIVGDDFVPNIWQHGQKYEPTMVFPFAVYFAEAVNSKLYALPYGQFLIYKNQDGFDFIDLTEGKYKNQELRSQFLNVKNNFLKKNMANRFPSIYKLYKKIVD